MIQRSQSLGRGWSGSDLLQGGNANVDEQGCVPIEIFLVVIQADCSGADGGRGNGNGGSTNGVRAAFNNDVSILFPSPQSAADMANMIAVFRSRRSDGISAAALIGRGFRALSRERGTPQFRTGKER